jgi:hypothetical protein
MEHLVTFFVCVFDKVMFSISVDFFVCLFVYTVGNERRKIQAVKIEMNQVTYVTVSFARNLLVRASTFREMTK